MTNRADRVEVELRLQDLASREVQQFGGTVDRTTRGAVRDFQRVNRETKKVGAGLGKMAIAATAAFAAFEAGRRSVGAGFGFVQAASDFDEAFSKFGVVFGAEAERVEQRIDEITSSIGRSKGAFIDYTSSFQDLLVPLGFTRAEAADLSVGLSELAVDVGSFSNALDADVVNDFKSALIGSSETVAKYGIVAKEANVQQEAYRLGIANVGEALTDQQKVLARTSLLFQGTSDAQGDALRTADSFANQTKRLQSSIGQLRVEFGRKLIPVIQQMVEDLGGLDAVTRDIEAGFGIVSAVTVGFIRGLGSGIKITRRFIEGLGGAQNAVNGFGIGVAIAEAGFLSFIEGVLFFGRVVGDVFAGFALSAEIGFNKFLRLADGATAGINKLLDGFEKFSGVSLGNIGGIEFDEASANSAFGDVASGVGDLILQDFEKLRGGLDEAAEAGARTKLAFKGVADALAGLSSVAKDSEIKDLLPTDSEVNGTLDIFNKFRSTAKPALDGEDGAAGGGRTLIGVLKDIGAAALEAGQKIGTVALENGERLMSSAAGASAAVDQYAASLSNFSLGQEAAQNAFGALESGLDSFSRDLIEGQANFGDFAKNIIKDIGQIIVKMLLLKAIRAALGISGTGGTTGGGFLGALGFANGGLVRGGIGIGGGAPLPVGAFANGGVVSEPTIGLVGEGKTDEAIIPLPGNRKVQAQVKGGGGNVTNHFTINMQSLDPAEAHNVFAQQMPFIRAQIAASIEGGSDRKLVSAVKGAR